MTMFYRINGRYSDGCLPGPWGLGHFYDEPGPRLYRKQPLESCEKADMPEDYKFALEQQSI